MDAYKTPVQTVIENCTALETSRGCTRYQIGPEDSVWICDTCESEIDDPYEFRGCDCEDDLEA